MAKDLEIEKLNADIELLKKELDIYKKIAIEHDEYKSLIKSLKLKVNRLTKQLKKKHEHLISQKNEAQLQQREMRAQAEAFLLTGMEFEKLSIVARKTDNAVMIMDSKGDFEWVNEGFIRMYGLTLEELITTRGRNIIETSTESEIFSILLEVVNEKKTLSFESIFDKTNGDKLWVHTTLTPILDDDEITKIIAVDSDITKLKLAEQQIIHKNHEIEAQRDALELKNSEIMSKSEKIMVQQAILEEKNNQIENQNENIRSSIRYALTIQQAALPQNTVFDKYFENFILYRPKDIVSGDFYWVYPVSESKIMIAVADCTGHGVPGAFMSLIGNQLLNTIVIKNPDFSPSDILEKLDVEVQIALRQHETDNQDGMDIILCIIEYINNDERLVYYCGSKRPLFYYNTQNQSIEQMSGDKKSIGGTIFKHREVKFLTRDLKLKQGDILYLTSDGVLDQNDSDYHKFGLKRFIATLNANATHTMSRQKLALEIELDKFQNNEEQCDDITVVGIKL